MKSYKAFPDQFESAPGGFAGNARALKPHTAVLTGSTLALFTPGLIGMALSFAAGLLALKWLSSWLSKDRWKLFGFYCVAFAGVVWLLR